MQIVSSKKEAQKVAREKANRSNLRALARSVGVPEFMMRFAQERRLKIFSEQFVPKYRHD